jgi:hypothetical protein
MPRPAELTATEREVLNDVAIGLNNIRIAVTTARAGCRVAGSRGPADDGQAGGYGCMAALVWLAI